MEKSLYFPIAFDKKTKGNKIFMKVLKADTHEFITMGIDQLLSIQEQTCLNYSTYKYAETENNSLLNCKKILVYNDIKNNLYGIISYTTFPSLWWISKDVFKEQNTKDDIMNVTSEENLFIVDETFCRSYNKDIEKNYRVANLKFTLRDNCLSVEEFENLLGIKTDKHETTEVEAEVDKANTTEENITENEETTQTSNTYNKEMSIDLGEVIQKHLKDGLDNIIKDLAYRESNLGRVYEEIKSREKYLNEKEKEINEREYSLIKETELKGAFDTLNAEIIVDEEDIVADEGSKEVKLLYDAFLKMLKKSDSISVPFCAFKLMHIIIKSRALERNSSYTKYTQIAVIKSDHSQIEGVLAMIEVDEENPVRVTVLKEYGLQQVTASTIQKYENMYRQWRRERSYIV